MYWYTVAIRNQFPIDNLSLLTHQSHVGASVVLLNSLKFPLGFESFITEDLSGEPEGAHSSGNRRDISEGEERELLYSRRNGKLHKEPNTLG